MKPFDLEAALNGEKVVTRDGREVKIAGYNLDAKEFCQITGWIEDLYSIWDINGKSKIMVNTDLFMAPTERKEWVVRWDTNICVTCKTRQSAEYMAENHKDIGIATIHEITIID